MRVLMTGNKGYIGSVMSKYLQDRGHRVAGLDIGFFKDCTLGDYDDTITIRSDIRDIEKAPLDLSGFDAVIHLAGLSNDPLGGMKTSLTYDINWFSSIKLALMARDAGVKRFLFASSCSMYGAGNGDEFLTEESPQVPLTAYAESKVYAEQGISRLATDDFSPVFFRCGTAYGASPRQRLDLVLNSMVATAYSDKKIYVFNGGRAWRPIVHVEDISQAFELGLIAPKNIVHNQVFNVGINLDNYRVIDLANIVHNFVFDSVIEVKDEGNDVRSYRVSFDKIYYDLGFSPKWSPLSGAKQLYETFKNYELKDFSKYFRLDFLENLMKSGRIDRDLRWIN